jgi:nitrous oxidase accessory protein NosD
MGSSGDAAVLLLNAQGVTIEDSTFLNNGSGFQHDHHIYVNSGCSDIVIRRNLMDTTPGAAVHIYHDPGPTNVLIEGNTMRNGYWGVVVGSNANGVRVERNTFAGNTLNIDNQRGTNVTASGNDPDDIIH